MSAPVVTLAVPYLDDIERQMEREIGDALRREREFEGEQIEPLLDLLEHHHAAFADWHPDFSRGAP